MKTSEPYVAAEIKKEWERRKKEKVQPRWEIGAPAAPPGRKCAGDSRRAAYRMSYVRCGGRGMGMGVSRRTDRRGKRERNTLECLAFGCLSVASHLDGIVKGGGWRLLLF